MSDIKKPAKAGKRQANATSFKKGQSGNPSGMKKGTVDFISQLKSELKNVEKEKGTSLIKFAIQKAYTNPQVLIALLKKIIPDMTQSDIKVESVYSEYEKLSDEELMAKANEIINRAIPFLNCKDIN